ncbi:TolC family protein [Massilia sp. YIM B02763]|uniref:TolC family protein n=1 Tax=Massilia sp. YIM B02763 TaxID=3050130 RepID=UPI0025B6608B|nr:TolC family protein [Massilia sp. YIM B02763]MDN4053138.1 TolC family protein [Massilia sp. YIM B02763]
MQSKHIVLGATVLLLQAAFPAAHAIGQQSSSTPVVAAPQAGVPASPLTLEQAIQLALSANPALRSATRSIGIAEGAVQQAGARPNPELSFLSEGTDRNTRTETTQINQVIELGGKRGARIAVAEQERNVAIDDVNARRAELRADVITAYMEALTAQERLALAQASLELAHKSTDVTSRRVTAGKISPVEQTRSSVAEAAVRLELAQAEADLALAKRRLTALWASPRPLDQSLQVPDTFGRLPAWPELAERLASSPQLRRAQSAVAGRDAQVKLERAQRIPDVTVTLGSQRERELGRTQGVVGLSLPLPLFNRNQGNILSALRRADQARDDLEAEQLRLTQVLADAYQRAEVASTQTVTLRDQVLPAAQSAYDAAVTGFEMGKFAFTDVLDAQRTLFQTKTQYLRALSDRYRSIADIERYVPITGTGVNSTERTSK